MSEHRCHGGSRSKPWRHAYSTSMTSIEGWPRWAPGSTLRSRAPACLERRPDPVSLWVGKAPMTSIPDVLCVSGLPTRHLPRCCRDSEIRIHWRRMVRAVAS